MVKEMLPFALMLIVGVVCLAAGYGVAARAGRRRESELSRELEETAGRYRDAMQKQSEAAASKESEAEDWKGCYETMVQSYDMMKQAYEGMKQAYEDMKQAAESYEEASNANREAYEGMKAANDSLLATIKKHEALSSR